MTASPFKKGQERKGAYDPGMTGKFAIRHRDPGQGGERTNLSSIAKTAFHVGGGAVSRNVSPARPKRYTSG
jgi:hypothetical protein